MSQRGDRRETIAKSQITFINQYVFPPAQAAGRMDGILILERFEKYLNDSKEWDLTGPFLTGAAATRYFEKVSDVWVKKAVIPPTFARPANEGGRSRSGRR